MRVRRSSDRTPATTRTDVAESDSVPLRRRALRPEALARSIGVGRLVLGGGFLVSPVAATRVLGVDSATAKRVSFLAQMMAARDVAIGAGTALSASRGRSSAGWLLAGAVADVTDAVVIAHALPSGRARGPVAVGIVGGAVLVSALAVYGAAGALRPHR